MGRRPIDKLESEGFVFEDWINAIEDTCLYETLTEAYVARFQAVRADALKYKVSKEVLRAGDQTTERIKYGRVTGQIACKKAATALRKYTQALKDAENLDNKTKTKTHRAARYE